MTNAERKEAERSTGDNSTMTPRTFRVGEPDAHRDDGLSVTETVGTVAKAIVSEAFLLTQPNHGDVFGWIDDHSEQLARAAVAAIARATQAQP
jgi:hypothetical protein